MTYIRNPRIPFQWESDGDYNGKFRADDGTLHETPYEADKHDKERRNTPVERHTTETREAANKP